MFSLCKLNPDEVSIKKKPQVFFKFCVFSKFLIHLTLIDIETFDWTLRRISTDLTDFLQLVFNFFWFAVRQEFMIHEDGAIAYQEQNEECKSSVLICYHNCKQAWD